MSTPAISIHNLNFAYAGTPVLENIQLDVAEGDFIGIVGPNGGGKSTLLKLMLGLLQPDSGELRIFGQTPRRSVERIGYVPQYANFAKDFPISVWETVLLGRLTPRRWFGGHSQKDKQLAEQALRETEIWELRERPIGALSGGQLQRVLIARALASQPDILLLDEPTASVDVRAEKTIFELLRHLNQRMTIIVVSHDVGFISDYVNRVACLNRKLVCHAVDQLDPHELEHLYGKHVHQLTHSH
ncbi:MAG: metal ABC transporter ATP-binding protein [Chitinivorax sp.]